MKEEEIAALAREYAEEEYKTLNLPTDHTEVSAYRYMDFARFLLRRYALVEREKLKAIRFRKVYSADDVRSKFTEECLIDALFPDLGKEVES